MSSLTTRRGLFLSYDMNSSSELDSPGRPLCKRTLRFGMSPDQENTSDIVGSPKKNPGYSPPYRRVRALRLFDAPATPKTLLQKSTTTNKVSNSRNSISLKPPKALHFAECMSPPVTNSHTTPALALNDQLLDNNYLSVNINPFTPNGQLMCNKKRSRTGDHQEKTLNGTLNVNVSKPVGHFSNNVLTIEKSPSYQAPKRFAMQDTNISRYAKEFVEIKLIGKGEFGFVYQCMNRLDGCVYAVKRSIKPVAGSNFERTALNEVWAHAVLGKHDNVVRYYSAWAEDNHMLIQNEYCDNGSLHYHLQNRFLVESELRTLLKHITEGLKYIHSNGLVHMDLKAGNIFLTSVKLQKTNADEEDLIDDSLDERNVVYKIGDLGHVTSISEPRVEEGDCRYLPREILEENYDYLTKADIFSLGMTIYEAGGGGPLPKNGPQWQQLRNGIVSDLSGLSREINDLIKLMIHPDPHFRPSPELIFQHELFLMPQIKTKSELARELSLEKRKNAILMKRLKEYKRVLKSYELMQFSGCKNSALNSPDVSSGRQTRSFTRKVLLNMGSNQKTRELNRNMIDNLNLGRI